MTADFDKPVTTDAYATLLAQIRDQIAAILTQEYGSASNIPDNATRWNPSTLIPEIYDSGTSTWARLSLLCGADRLLDKALDNTGLANGDGYVYDSANSKFVRAAILEGWIPILETFTYASATTVTVASNALLRFQPGDKIRLTNDSTTKYYYVTAVTATVLTLLGPTTLANSAITAVFLSRESNPLAFPAWFGYTPTFSGFSADPASVVPAWCINGRTLRLEMTMPNEGTSNSNVFAVSAPVAAASLTNMVWVGLASVEDAGTIATAPGMAKISAGGSTIYIFKDFAENGFTSSGKKRANFNIEYKI